MEEISGLVPKQQRNKFKAEYLRNAPEDVAAWAIKVKKAVLRYLVASKNFQYRVSCEKIYNYFGYKTQFYHSFDLYEEEDFTYLCIKDLAIEGYLKVSDNSDKTVYGFRQREIVYFNPNYGLHKR